MSTSTISLTDNNDLSPADMLDILDQTVRVRVEDTQGTEPRYIAEMYGVLTGVTFLADKVIIYMDGGQQSTFSNTYDIDVTVFPDNA